MDLDRADPATLSVRDEAALAPRERERLGRRPTLDNCAHFARHSTKHTQLFFVKIYRGARLEQPGREIIQVTPPRVPLVRGQIRRVDHVPDAAVRQQLA